MGSVCGHATILKSEVRQSEWRPVTYRTSKLAAARVPQQGLATARKKRSENRRAIIRPEWTLEAASPTGLLRGRGRGGSASRRSGGGISGRLAGGNATAIAVAATIALAAVAAVMTTMATIAAVAAVAAMAAVTVVAMAAVLAVAAVAAVAAMMTAAVAMAAVAATAIATAKQAGGSGAVTAHQGHADERHKQRNTKQNSAVHPRILQ